MTGTLPPLVGFRGGWNARQNEIFFAYGLPSLLCQGKGLVLPNQLHIDQIATNVRFLLIPLQNVEMSKKSPFAIHKALIGIGGEPKTVKRLREVGRAYTDNVKLSHFRFKFLRNC
ncbi:hypothetical protein TNCV_3919681 [Trichonephila clavipes]|nr:hypothetical protein TNCV_3919681 [Trichonephila clavipes]